MGLTPFTVSTPLIFLSTGPCILFPLTPVALFCSKFVTSQANLALDYVIQAEQHWHKDCNDLQMLRSQHSHKTTVNLLSTVPSPHRSSQNPSHATSLFTSPSTPELCKQTPPRHEQEHILTALDFLEPASCHQQHTPPLHD